MTFEMPSNSRAMRSGDQPRNSETSRFMLTANRILTLDAPASTAGGAAALHSESISYGPVATRRRFGRDRRRRGAALNPSNKQPIADDQPRRFQVLEDQDELGAVVRGRTAGGGRRTSRLRSSRQRSN